MKVKQIILILIAIALVGGYVYGLCWSWGDYIKNKDVVVSRTYAGRIYFQNAEEYSQFKQFLADNPKVRIDKLTALSSPDTLVDLRITAPPDIAVPYGEMVHEYKLDYWFTAMVITVLGVTILPLSLIPIYNAF